ncbi:MAG: NAD(P)H-hydrate dehydratase [Phycisphaerae bacterium]|jgi:ADP-dependent NAD(P)H-hydrate dehydratase|nr:NAD(P)H-hydrate dehydratase [Phycisphaerae bacterium]
MSAEVLHDLPPLPPRDPLGHKGTFGTVVVVGGHLGIDGERTMLGAPALAATAALRSGAGLAVLAMHAELLPAGLTLCPAATGVALPAQPDGRLDASGAAERLDGVMSGASVIALGPGFGNGTAEQQIVVRLLSQDQVPVVLDADGLNALASLPEGHRDIRASVIMTPHPGEFARLAESLGVRLDPLEPAGRVEAASELARRLGCIVVLKGAGTVVSDGLRAWVNGSGNAALATGGSGDVLAGLIAGLVAQFSRGPTPRVTLFDAARLAVHIHGCAADRWADRHGEAGMLPGDLADELPVVLAAMRGEAGASQGA